MGHTSVSGQVNNNQVTTVQLNNIQLTTGQLNNSHAPGQQAVGAVSDR
jgi:hypothetical protein